MMEDAIMAYQAMTEQYLGYSLLSLLYSPVIWLIILKNTEHEVRVIGF